MCPLSLKTVQGRLTSDPLTNHYSPTPTPPAPEPREEVMAILRPASTTRRTLLLGLLGFASLATVAHGHLVMAGGGNPFIRTDRTLQRLTLMLDDLVVATNLPPQMQPLWRRVVQQPRSTDMDQSPPALAADAAALTFRAEAVETLDSYVIQVDLPGVNRDAVRIAFHEGNVLGITATRSNPHEAVAADTDNKGSKGASQSNEAEVSSSADASSNGGEDVSYPKYLMREVAYGKSFRSFKLPSDASPDTAEAHFEHGVLTIIVKKRETPKEKLVLIQ